MDMHDLISVVVPVHNGQQYLRENAECILNQTYKNLEIIYVCDRCTDRTIDILNEYASVDIRLKVYIGNGNKGAAASRNAGMKLAQGDWIIFLDSDDLFELDMLEVMLKVALEKNSDMVCCFWETFTENPIKSRNIMNENIKLYCDTYPIIDVENEEKYVLQIVAHPVWVKLIRKSIYGKSVVYFQDIPNCNDVYFSLVVAMESKRIAYVDKVFVHYRSNFGRKTLSTNRQLSKSYIWEAYDAVFQYIDQRTDNRELKKSFYNRVCGCVAALAEDVLFEKYIKSLRDIFINRWGMNNVDVQKDLSYFNQMVYEKIYEMNCRWNGDILKLWAKKQFVINVARKGNCSIWGCGYEGKRLLEEIENLDIGINHIYDSDSDKWGKSIAGRVVEKYEGNRKENIIVTSPMFFEEIRKQIGNRIYNIYNLEKEIFIF